MCLCALLSLCVLLGSTKQLDSIQAQISQFKNYFPVSALTDVSRTLNTTQTEIKNILPQINNAEFIRQEPLKCKLAM